MSLYVPLRQGTPSALQLTGVAGPDAAKALAHKVLDALDANGFQITRAPTS